jgi:hypothetical protein
VELALPTVKISLECCEMDMVRYAEGVICFVFKPLPICFDT